VKQFRSVNRYFLRCDMIPGAVQCVLFDAVGTLISPDPPVHVAYAAAASEFGLLLDEATVEERFGEAFRKHYARSTPDDNYTTSEDIERGRWHAIVNDVFFEIGPCEALFERLWSHFAQPVSWRLFDDAAEPVRRLSQRGLSVGFASNFDRRLIEICRAIPPLDRCDYCFVSSQIGFRKPARHFFHAIEQATGLEPQQLMLIGDDWDTDYLAASAAGWHAVHLNRSSDAAAVVSIRSLVELCCDL
jgi:putative hydrolase of the HAD superfamily